MKYDDSIRSGQLLVVNARNPMNSGYTEGERVIVDHITCTGDLSIKSVDTNRKGILYRSYLSPPDQYGVTRTQVKKKIKMMQEAGMSDDDIQWEERLERLGL